MKRENIIYMEREIIIYIYIYRERERERERGSEYIVSFWSFGQRAYLCLLEICFSFS
jgi:hypothetical protein